MTLTRWRDLAGLFVVFGVSGFLLTRGWYLRIPTLSWLPGATLFLIALFEISMATRLRAVISHNPDAKPMPAIVVARWIALGRASALAGAVVAGLAAGFTLYVLTEVDRLASATGDIVAGLVLTSGAVALTGAGLVLERAGVAPRPPIEGQPT